MAAPPFPLPRYLRDREEYFRAATRRLRSESSSVPLSEAGEWLLDNYYLVQRTCRLIREEMPRSFFRQLPKLGSGRMTGYPRILAAAQKLIVMRRAKLSQPPLKRFLLLYQQLAGLTTGELWAFPVMLRLGLIELLAQSLGRLTGIPPSTSLPAPALTPAAAGEETVADCITSLRLLAGLDWLAFFESVSGIEQILREDPAGVYAGMDRETRNRYRGVIETLARAAGRDEPSVARLAIELARAPLLSAPPSASHVGYYLIDAGRPRLEAGLGCRAAWRIRLRRRAQAHPAPVYLASIGILTIAGLLGGLAAARAAGGKAWLSLAVGLLCLIPALTIAVGLVNWIITLTFPPRVLPKMDFEEAIPAEFKTLVVIPSLLSDAAEVKSLLQQLELHYLRSQDAQLYFGLLTDLPDTPRQPSADSDPRVAQASDGIRALNERHRRETSGPFYLFHRDSRWNPSEERWMGWERKRGKLHQLNRLLRGGAKTAFSVLTGDLNILPEFRYVITLDADTLMPREAAHRLVAALAHPLNRAAFDPPSGAVVAGYTLLQPRIEITSTSVNRSRFTRIFAGDVGFDLYSRAVSDAYQDLFGEGSYVGKGIYEIDAFERSLAGRMPENALLSHDLIEGLHGRVGLVTDVALYEDYPPHYFVFLRRAHRWIRGDWQLLPWLLPRVPAVGGGTIPSDLSAIGRWKILDNLRRSLLAPALLALLAAGWLWLPGSPLLWTLAAGMTLAVPSLTGLAEGWARAVGGSPSRNLTRSLLTSLARWGLALAFLLYEAWLTLQGVATTLVRLFVTRMHLLQWTSYAETVRASSGKVTGPHVLAALLSVGALAGLILGIRPGALAAASPILSGWLLAPLIAWWISRPIDHAPDRPSPAETAKLRLLARRTWSYFEQFVGPEDHWLPPDHFQESPRGAVVHSTSPTNIGLYLLSTLAAHDLGHLGLMEMAARLRATFEGLARLEKHRGHFLNWYDTRTLEPLAPRFVSTVDSGNLAASLLTLGQGCRALPRQVVPRREAWDGLLDTLGLFEDLGPTLPAEAAVPLRALLAGLRRQVVAVRGEPKAWPALADRLIGEPWDELNRALMELVASHAGAMDAETLDRLGLAADRTHRHLAGLQREIETLTPWLAALSGPPPAAVRAAEGSPIHEAWRVLRAGFPESPRLEEIGPVCAAAAANLRRLSQAPGLDPETLAWCERLALRLPVARATAEDLLSAFRDAAGQAADHVLAMNFRLLYDERRHLFHIGYNVSSERLDENHYDLLASEARIASIIAIARNEVPTSHWVHLGRPLARMEGQHTLLSWGGTMFEYLMPALLIRSYPGTLLERSCRAAVDGQIEYAKRKKIPWGISESGYYAFDAEQNYQYRAFGVPGLGFMPDRADDLVVSPYASLLALSLRPRCVFENLARLTGMGLMGPHGFYEAVDFAPARMPPGQTRAVVRSYMAHHQGMILLSLVNYLRDGVMTRRFHADPVVRSIEFFLQEKVPVDAPLDSIRPEDGRGGRRGSVGRRAPAIPWSAPAHSPAPQVHLLSNGSYGALITNGGAGFSRWKGLDLTRWRADTTREECGVWIYCQDLETREVWSAADQPTAVPSPSQTVRFHPHMAVFQRGDHGLGLTMEVAVAPDDDVEIRRLSLTNHGDGPRRIALTSYGEIILARQAADARQPAFNGLFIESERLPDLNALLFRRRPRSGDEEPVFLVHAAVVSPGQAPAGTWETDRARFLGRGGTPRRPAALAPGGTLTGTAGATLDPVMALSQSLLLPPRASAQASFLIAAARSREQALALAQRYKDPSAIERAFEQARIAAEAEMTESGLTVTDLEEFDRLLAALIYPRAALRADAATLTANRRGQPGLWPFSISGDHPILMVRASTTEDLTLVRQALRAYAYWRRRGLPIDLIILNLQGTTYGQDLRAQLQRVFVRHSCPPGSHPGGGLFALNADQMTPDDRNTLETAARVVLSGADGSLADQLRRLDRRPAELPAFVPMPGPGGPEATPPVARPDDLLFDNGLGGFSPDGREYVIYLEPGRRTPAPWINVIANPDFGFIVSETGAGPTWFGNSSENRLTPWSGDPVADPPGEAVYLRDEETAEVWSPTPGPCGAEAPYLVRHGAGYSVFEHASHGLSQRLQLFVPPEAPVKIVRLRLANLWDRQRRVTATFYAEWVLEALRDVAQTTVVSEYDSDRQALLARNPGQADFGGRVAFAAASQPLHGLTADRTEFLGRRGDLRRPAALDRIGLASVVGPGLDPCAAVQLHIDLRPGESKDVHFLLGQGADRADALAWIERFQDAGRVEDAWRQAGESWNSRLGTVQVRTPDPAMDLILNRWLLYQTLACRIWARSAAYQSSGAFGFRDQLQDVMALAHAEPGLFRRHLLLAAQQQFEAGDVLHWWHPPSGRGVRTRFSDDLLWLPFAAANYVAATGDDGILDERMAFLQGPPLRSGETERYALFDSAREPASLYEHCRQALDKADTAGAHGLPLMGSGDWNDGMNRVGLAGRGESVWLGWFLCATLSRFAGLAERRGERVQAAAYRRRVKALAGAIEACGWDGAWYLRAFYDDGSPLGSAADAECQIDSVAQSWAVLSGAGDPGRAAQAMASVAERLVSAPDQLLLLLAPPFDRTPRDPGYIKGYPPGVRENGAQYTHAATWAVEAFARLGQGDRAEALFRMLNPIYHADTPAKAERYGVEPYVIAADISSAPSRRGRGGWTWYTGSSGLMYRLGLEAILGIRRMGRSLRIDPCIPKAWPGYQVTYRVGQTTYSILVENPEGVNRGVRQVTLDGGVLTDQVIPLREDGGTHLVGVRMGVAAPEAGDPPHPDGGKP